MANVRRITYTAFGNANTYLVSFDGESDALLVDCSRSYKTVKKICEDCGLQVKLILLTHGHIDHILDVNKFKADGAKIAIHPLDADKLYTDKNLGSRFGLYIDPVEPDLLLQEGVIDFNGHSIKVIHTPGHTDGGVSFEIDGMLFTGDTLFKGTIGRTDFEDGDYATLMHSLDKLKSYPDDTIVYPGHEYETTILIEKKYNPYFK